MLENIKILLASTSQSRKKILNRAGINFYSKKHNINESTIKKKFKNKKHKTKNITKELAKLKCQSVMGDRNTIVVGCEPMGALNGVFFDQP